MTPISRFPLALGTALVLLLFPINLQAGQDAPVVINGPEVPPQETRGPETEDIVGTINICVPKNARTFETSASLLFLQPGSGNLMYGTLTNPFPFLSPHWNDQSVRPDFTPTFNVAARYLFECGALQLDWTHLNSDDHASSRVAVPYTLGQTSGPSSIQALGPPYLVGPPVPFATAYAVAHFDFDAVNLQGEYPLNLGRHVQLRPFAGVQIARINETLAARFQSIVYSLGFINDTQSTFTGAGPRLGVEMHYLAAGLDLLGGIAGGTLIGSRQSHIDMVARTPLGIASGFNPNIQSLQSPDSTQVIPCIEGKLAASYTFPLGNCRVLKCEAGYQAAVYINAINQYSLSEVENSLTADGMNTPETTGSAVFLRTAFEAQTNFLVHGPFVKFSLEF